MYFFDSILLKEGIWKDDEFEDTLKVNPTVPKIDKSPQR